MVDHEKGRKLSRSKKYLSPHLVGSEKGEKLTPSEIFCFGSEMEPFFVYGIKIDAMSIPDFIGVAAKLMPYNKAPASFQKQTLVFRILFYRSSRISSSLISSVGLPLATSLFRKDNRAFTNNRRSPAQSANTRFLLYLNITTPQQ